MPSLLVNREFRQMQYSYLTVALFLSAAALAQEPVDSEPKPVPRTFDIANIAELVDTDPSWRPYLTTRLYYEFEQDDFEYWESFIAARFTLPQIADSLSSTLTLSAERADIDTPAFVDLPEELYVLSVNYSWIRQLSKEWTLRLNANPRFASDFDNTSSDAWRLRAAAMAVYRPSPRFMLGLGLILTGNEDIPIVAGPGVIWRPKRYLELDIFFPRPRINFLVARDRNREGWFYIQGEWDNETWAYERFNGDDNEVTYRNLKAALGFEYGPRGGLMGRGQRALRWYLEAGYVFERELDFDGVPDFEPDNTAYFEAGLSF